MRLSDADITAIAAFLGLSEFAFIQSYTRLRPKRDGLALIDKPNGECVFLDGIDCAIQPVKPRRHIFPRHGGAQKTDRLRYLGGFQTRKKTPPHLLQRAPSRPLASPEQITYAHAMSIPHYNLTPRQRACETYEKQLRKRGGLSEQEIAALITLF